MMPELKPCDRNGAFICPDCLGDIEDEGIKFMAMGFLYGAGNKLIVPLSPYIEKRVAEMVSRLTTEAHEEDNDVN